MVLTFQLMILYAMLDPLLSSANSLLVATGHPSLVMHSRIVQTVVFIPAVIGLGLSLGIEGVALAADLMILTGTVMAFRYTRKLVAYSARALWLWPLVAVMFTVVVMFFTQRVWDELPLPGALVGKALFSSLLYLAVLWLAERDQLRTGWEMVWGLLRPRLVGRAARP
jgi:O-antigen/teichoic acid export membrane protein